MSSNCLYTLLSAAVVLLAGGFTVPAQTNLPPSGKMVTQVVIVGTLHDRHQRNTNYSLAALQKIIVCLKPSAILVELPPEIRSQRTVVNGRAAKWLESDEHLAANRAADELGVSIISFDREGRNEFYARTHYFDRQRKASELLLSWIDAQTRKDTNSIQVRAVQLQRDASERQRCFTETAGPEVINGPDFDMVIATKHLMMYDLVPRCLLASGKPELAEEYHFFAEEWHERNQIMARNVQEIARGFAGKRLVVLTGSEHRYLLRELLGKAPGLKVKEFYEIPSGRAGTHSMQ